MKNAVLPFGVLVEDERAPFEEIKTPGPTKLCQETAEHISFPSFELERLVTQALAVKVAVCTFSCVRVGGGWPGGDRVFTMAPYNFRVFECIPSCFLAVVV